MVKRVVVLLCVFGLVCSTASAEGKKKKKKGGLAAILNAIDLTDEQKPKVDELVASFRGKVKAAESKEDKKAARQEFEAGLESVLTAEQMEKFREERKKMRGKGKKKKKAEE